MLSLTLAVGKQSSVLGQAFPRCCRGFFLHLQLGAGEQEPALLWGYPPGRDGNDAGHVAAGLPHLRQKQTLVLLS